MIAASLTNIETGSKALQVSAVEFHYLPNGSTARSLKSLIIQRFLIIHQASILKFDPHDGSQACLSLRSGACRVKALLVLCI
jgi:hypothetical protein